jgi:hypothetical protein
MHYIPTIDGPTILCLLAALLVWLDFRERERRIAMREGGEQAEPMSPVGRMMEARRKNSRQGDRR